MKKKILQLFKYRQIPKLVQESSIKDKKQFLDYLVVLQKRIYELDSYLESNWKIKSKKLEKYWKGIYEAIQVFGYDINESESLSSHIKRYQLHELQLRDNKLPMRLSKEYYYYYKSCDVRLMRQIILDKSENEYIKLSDWRLYDLVTEVNDDVEDIFEDCSTINGNAFLLHFLSVKDIQNTEKEFIDFLDDIKSRSIKKFGSTQDLSELELHYNTMLRINETKQLISRNLIKFTKKKLKKKNIKILGYLNF